MITRSHRGVRRGLVAAASLLAVVLGGGVGQALAAPDLDPYASYTVGFRSSPNLSSYTTVVSPSYSIGGLQTIRQTYSCGGAHVLTYPGAALPFDNRSPAGVSATLDGGAPGSGSILMLFTNWTLSPSTYSLAYQCDDIIGAPGGAQAPGPLPGQRVHAAGDPAIYLIDEGGSKRHIPDPQAYTNLFRDWTSVQVADLSSVPVGPELSSGAYLGWDGTPGHGTYLVSNGQKRWITSPAVMDKFDFAWSQVRQVPKSWLDAAPDGQPLT